MGLCALQRQLHAFGQELLDTQIEAVNGAPTGRVRTQLQTPAPGRHVGAHGALEQVVTALASAQLRSSVRSTIGLLQRREQRLLAGQRATIEVAQQRGNAQRLSGTVQITPGPDEHTDLGRGAAVDVELGQIQRGLTESQQRHLVAALPDQHMAAVDAVVELGGAVAIAEPAGDAGAVLVEYLDFDAAQCFTIGEGASHDPQAIAVRARVQADIAADEIGGLVFALKFASGLQQGEIETGCGEFGDLVHRQVRGLAFVRQRVDDEAVEIHRVSNALQFVQAPVAAPTTALKFRQEARQIAGADAKELDVHLGHIHGDHGQTIGALAGQDAALAGETRGRRKIDRLDVAGETAGERLAIGGDHARQDLDLELLFGLDVRKEHQASAVGGHPRAVDRLAGAVGDLQILRQVLGLGERS